MATYLHCGSRPRRNLKPGRPHSSPSHLRPPSPLQRPPVPEPRLQLRACALPPPRPAPAPAATGEELGEDGGPRGSSRQRGGDVREPGERRGGSGGASRVAGRPGLRPPRGSLEAGARRAREQWRRPRRVLLPRSLSPGGWRASAARGWEFSSPGSGGCSITRVSLGRAGWSPAGRLCLPGAGEGSLPPYTHCSDLIASAKGVLPHAGDLSTRPGLPPSPTPARSSVGFGPHGEKMGF